VTLGKKVIYKPPITAYFIIFIIPSIQHVSLAKYNRQASAIKILLEKIMCLSMIFVLTTRYHSVT